MDTRNGRIIEDEVARVETAEQDPFLAKRPDLGRAGIGNSEFSCALVHFSCLASLLSLFRVLRVFRGYSYSCNFV